MAQGNIGGYQQNQRELPPFIEFFKDSEEDREESLKQKRLIMRDVDKVRIRQRGSKDFGEKNVDAWLVEMRAYSDGGHQPASWADEYEQAYEKWKRGEENGPVKGFDLRNWPGISKAQFENCKSMGILSVEEVAEMNEVTMTRIGMGARALKERAKAWLQVNAGAVNPEEVAQNRATLASQAEQIKDLQAQLAKLGGGRK